MIAPARSRKADKSRPAASQPRTKRIARLIRESNAETSAATLAMRGRSVRFETVGAADLIDALSFVYGAFLQPPAAEGVERVRRGRGGPTGAPARCRIVDAKGRLRLMVGRKRVWQGRRDARAEAIMALDECAAGHLLPRSEAGVAILHGSCVQLDPTRSVLLLAPSGNGKSVLTSALVAAGASLVADDLVPVALDSLRPIGFPRAIAAKPGAPIPMGGHFGPRTLEGVAAPMSWWRVRSALAPGELGARIIAMVFCDYVPGVRARLLPVTPDEAMHAASVRVVEEPDPTGAAESSERGVVGALVDGAFALYLRHGNSAAAASLLLRALGR